jgi:hypothetical protein
MIFGKYSSKYVNTVKKYTGKSPYPYCIKDDFINHVAGFFKASKNLKTFGTHQKIIFSNEEFGQKFKSFLRKNPKPFCINVMRYPQFDLKVLGYRDTLFSVEMKKYFFFINGVFIFGQFTFKNPTAKAIEEISAIIGVKYVDNVELPPVNYQITDFDGTSLFCENNGFHLSLGYLYIKDLTRLSLLKKFWQDSTTLNLKSKSSLEKELMDKL